MGCLLALFALISPRFAMAMVWIFTDRVDIAYDGNIVPLMGLLLLPWTALTYTFAYAPAQGVSTVGWCCVGAAFLADLLSYVSGGRQRAETESGGYQFAPAPHSTHM